MLPSIKRKPSSSPANSPHKLGKQGPSHKNLSDIPSTPEHTSCNVPNAELTPVTCGDTCTPNERQFNENADPISMTGTKSSCTNTTQGEELQILMIVQA